jgi:hypothetical protein
MNFPHPHQPKDNSDDEINENFHTAHGSDRCGHSGTVLERGHRPEHWFESGDRGSGYYRQAANADELCRSRTAHGQAVRGWRVLLLEVARGIGVTTDPK